MQRSTAGDLGPEAVGQRNPCRFDGQRRVRLKRIQAEVKEGIANRFRRESCEMTIRYGKSKCGERWLLFTGLKIILRQSLIINLARPIRYYLFRFTNLSLMVAYSSLFAILGTSGTAEASGRGDCLRPVFRAEPFFMFKRLLSLTADRCSESKPARLELGTSRRSEMFARCLACLVEGFGWLWSSR